MSVQTKKGPISFRTWVACGFGLGFAPVAPGTVATAALALPVRFLGPFPLLWEASAVVLLATVGVYLCTHAEEQMGRDASSIVFDEFVGFLVAMLVLPREWPVIMLVFALFRLFDIAKPFPAGISQRLPGGLGVVADDVIAGAYTAVSARIVLALIG